MNPPDNLYTAYSVLADHVDRILFAIIFFATAVVFIKILVRFMNRFFGETKLDETLEEFIQKTVETLMWLITAGIVLVILGIDLNAVLASFGIIGFIVGFALKDTLSNLAAGVMILINKPFHLGDEIEVSGNKGQVKSVSISNTTLFTEDKVKVIIPNTVITGNVLKNHTPNK